MELIQSIRDIQVKVFDIKSYNDIKSLFNEVSELRVKIIDLQGFDISLYKNELSELKKIEKILKMVSYYEETKGFDND